MRNRKGSTRREELLRGIAHARQEAAQYGVKLPGSVGT